MTRSERGAFVAGAVVYGVVLWWMIGWITTPGLFRALCRLTLCMMCAKWVLMALNATFVSRHAKRRP